ncbi:hypothetical protein ATO6_22300 [Oceanicola sp. 22II-s10i]|nr:hypothetical protein ATO6_22300 [Oceanicola sp. 22II-s10i]
MAGRGRVGLFAIDHVPCIADAVDVMAVAAFEPVVVAGRITRTAIERVVSEPAVQAVGPGAAIEVVIAAAAIHQVIVRAAEQLVVMRAAEDRVRAGAAADRVLAGAAFEPVVATVAVDDVVAGQEERILAILYDRIGVFGSEKVPDSAVQKAEEFGFNRHFGHPVIGPALWRGVSMTRF